MYTHDTPLWQLTVAEYIELNKKLIEEIRLKEEEKEAPQSPDVLRGLDGLAAFLGCCKRTALKLKQSGKIDAAYIQEGRKILFDKKKLIDCLKQNGY